MIAPQLYDSEERSSTEDYERLIDEEIEEERLFERFLEEKANTFGVAREKYSPGKNVRRDLAEVLTLKDNESKFRKLIANIFRMIREEAHNGYRNLSAEEQEKILGCRLDFIGDLFSNNDIFYSRRKLVYSYGRGEVEKPIPLRKDVTIKVMRVYKPEGLFEAED